MLSKQFLTVKDVAELLKVSDVTVRHWIRGGDLRAIDLGREWRIAPADLEDFIQRHETVGRRSAHLPDTAGKPRRDQPDRASVSDGGKC